MSDSNQTVIVDIHLQESDFQRANFWFRLGKWSIRLSLFILLLFGLLLLSLVQFSEIFANPIRGTGLVVLIGFPILYPILIWFQTKRGFANLQDFQKNVRYELTANGYKVSDSKSSSDISWDSVLRAVESKHSFNLFFSKSFFHVIPKRCFKSSEDIERLKAMLKRGLAGKANVFLESAFSAVGTN